MQRKDPKQLDVLYYHPATATEKVSPRYRNSAREIAKSGPIDITRNNNDQTIELDIKSLSPSEQVLDEMALPPEPLTSPRVTRARRESNPDTDGHPAYSPNFGKKTPKEKLGFLKVRARKKSLSRERSNSMPNVSGQSVFKKPHPVSCDDNSPTQTPAPSRRGSGMTE